MRTATLLPLHDGRAPRWLFSRMVRLGGKISEVIINEYGAEELVRRLADSNWFQAFACALGYDWHSSGVTTVTMGALKNALAESKDIAIAGGKGRAGTKAPEEIEKGAERLSIYSCAGALIEHSRLAAKIDTAMIYDDFSIYHHSFIFAKSGKWAVVQQAMGRGSTAIRFQWYSDFVDEKDIANEPHMHNGIASMNGKSGATIDLTYQSNAWVRESLVEALQNMGRNVETITYPARHQIIPSADLTKRGMEALKNAYEKDPKDYRELLLVKGVGRKVIKSLALVASLIYEKELAMRDPVLYAYNVGGKDGIPYRISRSHYDKLIESFSYIVDSTNISEEEKTGIMKRLSRI
ncbi:MAG: DUF763 domain-containing protein [Candidatus Micrarchaeia archaeon]